MIKMKKIINKPEDFVDEMLEGILKAYPDKLKYIGGDPRCIVNAKSKKHGKVGILTGGGSGHLPLFLGFVGKGMLDGCAVGDIFASPGSNQIFEITKEIDSGNGVLYIYGNYSGDIMNFDMAAEMAKTDDIKVEQVIATDDVASAPKDMQKNRRGVAGLFYIYKIAGAYSEELVSLNEVKRIAEKVNKNVRTMGVGLSPCIIPEAGTSTFETKEGEMEIGIGIHGEAGVGKDKLKSADEIVNQIIDSILKDLPYESGYEVSVLVNGLGATPREELFIVYRRVAEILDERNIKIFNTYIGEFATSLEMVGMSISLLKLDKEIKKLLKKSAQTPFFEQIEIK